MPRKQDPYATAGQKVVGLYSLLLFTGRAYSLGQLARLFGCSKQTVLRMVEQIEMTHRLRLRAWVEGRERWYRAETPRERPNVSLTVEEIQQLLLCRDIVWHWLPRQLREDVEGTIAKTAVLLPDYEGREDALRPLAGARPKGIVDYSGSQDQVEAVMRGLRERRVCEVAYHSPERKQPKVMAVAPYQLLAYREGLYVRCRLEKALPEPEKFYDPTLALHRMRSVAVTGRRFEPIAVRPEDAAAGGFGLSRGEPFRVVVDVIPKAAMYVSERIWSADQVIHKRRDGGLRLEFTANSRTEVLNWVLSFGGEATLIVPQDIREEIRARAITISAQHE